MIPSYSVFYIVPYLTVFLLMFVCSFRLYNINRNTALCHPYLTWFPLYIVGVVFICFFGLRGFLFTDYLNYYKIFDSVPTIFNSNDTIYNFFHESEYKGLEKGFLISIIFLKSIWPNYFFFQFSFVFVDFMLLYSFSKEYVKDYIPLAFCFFFIFNGPGIEINLIRNAKAIFLFLFSIKYLERKRYLTYIVLNIIGLLFHTSAIFYILLTPFYYFKVPKKLILFMYIVGNFFFFTHIKWCIAFLNLISDYLPGRLGFLVRTYVGINKGSFGLSVGFLERTLTFWIVFFSMKDFYQIKKLRFFYNCIFIYLFLYLYFTELPIIQNRIGSLFVFAYWILYPNIYSKLKKDYKILFLGCFFLYSILKIYSTYRYNIHFYDFCFNLKYNYQERVKATLYYLKYLRD